MAKKIPRWFLVLAVFGVSIIALVLALLGSIGYTRGFTGQLVDANGKPLQGAFVVFIYRNDSLNPGGPIEHVFASGILETDQNGQFQIPARFDFCIPWLETSPQPWIEEAYSPATHSCLSANAFQKSYDAFDESYDDLEMNVHKVTMPDSSNDLQQRAGALESLITTMDFRIIAPPKPVTHLKTAPGVDERLVSALRSEYNFLQPKLFPEIPPSKTPDVDASNILSSSMFLPSRKFFSLRYKIDAYENEMKKEHQMK